MGLSIVVGVLAATLEEGSDVEDFEAQQASVNRLLAARGLPPHVEPRTAPTLRSRCSTEGFRYSTLHYLRRAYAHRARDPDWAASPVPDGVDPAADPVVEEAAQMFDSHLLCHSDCEGWYVPVDFPDVIFATETEDIPGAMLGSTQRLRAELALVAPALDIALDANGDLSDAEAARLDDLDDNPMGRELTAWLLLWESARISLAEGHAIVFG